MKFLGITHGPLLAADKLIIKIRIQNKFLKSFGRRYLTIHNLNRSHRLNVHRPPLGVHRVCYSFLCFLSFASALWLTPLDIYQNGKKSVVFAQKNSPFSNFCNSFAMINLYKTFKSPIFRNSSSNSAFEKRSY